MSSPPVAIVLGGRRQRVIRAALVSLCLFYVLVLLLAPFIGILITALKGGFHAISDTLGRPDVRHAYLLTGVITFFTVSLTSLFGLVVAWVLSRDKFRGRTILNGLVDLPFAVSPVIVGLMAVLLFGRGGWFEPFFASRGIQIIFAVPSMVLVTAFICIPFVIRSVVPILNELGTDEEEAAKTLGASPLRTFFRVTLPNIRWGLLYGTALSSARALGEVGAVLIVSGAIQGQTETVPLFVLRALEERQESQGYLVALSLAVISILILLGIEFLKRRQAKERSL
jgi:sulfate transport system permease protein